MQTPFKFQTRRYLATLLLVLLGYAHAAHSEQASPSSTMPPTKPPAETCTGSPIQCAKTVTSTFDNQGGLWIVFVSDQHLYVQFSADKGQTFRPAVKVNPLPEAIIAHDENRPKIKLDQQGTLYLTWSSQVHNPQERHSGNIRFSRSTDGGKTFAEPTTVNDDNQAIGHGFDNLAIGKNGEVFISWLDARDTVAAKQSGQEFIGSSVYYTGSEDGGKHFYPNKAAAAHACQCCRLQTEIDTDNTPVIIWRHIFEGGIRDHALLKFNDWQTPGEITRFSYENWQIDACPHHGTGFSIADDGTYHAVWFSNSNTQQGLFYGYSTDKGKSFSKPINFAKQGAGHPHVLAMGKQVFIVWQQFDGTQTHIQLLKSSDAGVTWSKATEIAKTDKKADQPLLIGDGKTAYLSWKVSSQDYHLQAILDK